MKKLLLVGLAMLFAASAVYADQMVTYGWEDMMTVLAVYPDGQMICTNVGSPDPVYAGLRSLKLEDNAPSGTPQAYVAWITNLADGDSVVASFWRYDVTPSGAPSVRIWGHYNDTDSCTGYNTSASGQSDYGPGLGWDQATYTYQISGHTGLVIEARTYSNPGDIVWIDDLTIYTNSDDAVVILPSAGPSAVENTQWGQIKALYQ